MRWTLVALALISALAFGGVSSADRWDSSAVSTEPAQLPRLDQPLVLDGDLREWGSAAYVPIRCESSISRAKQKGKWQGPADSGMEVYCAWSPEGLCLAAVVADDDVFNDRKGEAFWRRDSIEFHFDGRAPDKLMTPTQELGVEHVYYRPPNGEFPAEAYVRPDNRGMSGLKCAGKRTPTGYTAELLVPWSAFPAFKSEVGSLFAMQWVVCDYDARDGKDITYPATLSYLGAKYLRVKPQDYVKWALVDNPAVGPGAGLGCMFALDSPQTLIDARPMSISVEACKNLADRIGSVQVKAVDADGKVLLDRQVELSPLPKPWDGSKAGKLAWPDDVAAQGFGSVEATVRDKQGNVIGTATRPFLAAGGVVDGLLSRLEKADLRTLARTEPFKAGAYLGAASTLERLERWLAAGQLSEIVPAIREVEARFDVLEDGKLDGKYPGLLDLLTLAADPESGVVVEFPPRSNPTVLFTWGSFPLASANVIESASAEEAMKAIEPPGAGWQRITIGGCPASVCGTRYVQRASGAAAYDPSMQVILAWPPDRQARMTDVGYLKNREGFPTVVLPGCPTAIREAVEASAKKPGGAMIELDTALTKPTVVIAGDISGTKFAGQFKTYWVRSAYYTDGFGGLILVKGKRVINVSAPTRKVAERAAELIASGMPIKPSDVDAMRRDLVEELAPKVALDSAPPKGGVYLGDTHLHTIYSDGIASPVEMVLEGMYANLDYMVITDHQTLTGAQEAQRLLAEYGVSYPVTVGEEITAQIHSNAYPVKKLIPPLVPPQAIEAAHAQGAVIQWNHPGYPTSDWVFKYFNGGTIGTGFDAWEHYTDDLDRWKARGIMPVVVGSTDNHSTNFAWCERTAIIAPSGEGEDLANAIRDRRAALVAPMANSYLYGPDEMPYWVWHALADGASVKKAQAERLRTALQDADIIGLLRASPPVKPK